MDEYTLSMLVEELDAIDEKINHTITYSEQLMSKNRQLEIRLAKQRSEIKHITNSLKKEIKGIADELKEISNDFFLIGKRSSLLVDKEELEKEKNMIDIDFSKLEPL